jgi:hypothetical protein
MTTEPQELTRPKVWIDLCAWRRDVKKLEHDIREEKARLRKGHKQFSKTRRWLGAEGYGPPSIPYATSGIAQRLTNLYSLRAYARDRLHMSKYQESKEWTLEDQAELVKKCLEENPHYLLIKE